ncbi:unnamed protein product [Calicophoron daubneyi]|uniref:Armadillo repeat-containing protein 1 n=1 Tax=Calicophoron daubneyi TaxID=300641 RepID=A0AAV2TIF9_CALDB
MSDLNTLNDLKLLAEDPENHRALLEDRPSLQGLVLLLSNSNEDVVALALETLALLSDKPGGLRVLRSLLGLSQQLSYLINVDPTNHKKSRTIKKLAESLSNSLSVAPKEANPAKKGVCRDAFNPNSPNFRPKSVILRLYGVSNETDLEVVRSRLLRVRGVVSVTFQLHKNRVLVCTVPDLDPQVLVREVRGSAESGRSSFGSNNNNESEPELSGASELGIRARILRKKSHLHRASSISRSKSVRYSKRSDGSRISVLPPYLEEGADLFEVDESRAAPELKVNLRSGGGAQSHGPIGWLSEFLERSFFW